MRETVLERKTKIEKRDVLMRVKDMTGNEMKISYLPD